MKTISVIMSVFNETIEWVMQAVESIQNQTYPFYEFLIVIDNPVLDQKLKAFLVQLSDCDTRIKLLWNETNLGLAKSLNKGIEFANGDYIARMDADDIALPGRFEKEVAALEEYDVISCQRIEIDEHGNEIGEVAHRTDNANKELLYSNFIVHPGVMMKADAVRAVGGYRNFFKSQDYDLWLRMIDAGFRIGVLDEAYMRYRVRDNSISTKNVLEQYYISEYQKLLHRERMKKGKDSFSEIDLRNYLNSKHITPQKIERYKRARRETNTAIIKFRNKKPSFIANYLKALFIMPEIPLRSAKAVIGMKL